MICISVTPESRKLAKVDLLNASRHGDLIELCLDHLVKEPDITDLLGAVDKPIIVSCRRPQEGGHWKGTDEQRTTLLRQAIVAGPAYIELDLDIAKSIPRFGDTKRVISYTSLDKPLGKIDSVFEQAAKANADVVKFTWPTATLDGAWPLLAAVTQKREIPVVGMGFGEASLMFSLLGRKYGSPWIYAALEKGMEAHPGQPTAFELDELYDWNAITPQTRFVGLFGYGPAEPTTVRVLNAGFRALDLNLRCLPLRLSETDRLAKMLDVLRINSILVAPALGGQLLGFAGSAEDAATGAQYSDLLLKQSDGWHAYNLLWRSALQAVETALGKKSSGDRPLDRRNVLLIGANVTAQSIAYGIKRRKGILSISAPAEDKAKHVAELLDCRHVPFANLYDTLADVVVITDPNIGIGHRKSEFNPSYLRPHMTVLDVCRMPERSDLSADAAGRGCNLVEPSNLFADQISAQFEAVTGKPMPPEVLADSWSAQD